MFTCKRSILLRVLPLLFVIGLLVGCDESLPTQQNPKSTSPRIQASGESSSTSVNEDSSHVIPGQYLVLLKDKAGNMPERAQNLASNYGGKIFGVWSNVAGGFAVKNMSKRDARALAKNPNVKSVEPDVRLSVAIRQQVGSNPGDAWGLDRVSQRNGLDNFYLAGAVGAGVTAYVIDSGVRTSHNSFGNRASHGYDFVDNDATANDCDGHGTHVAGTLGSEYYGVAQGVDIVGVRVLDCDGFAPSANTIIQGVEWVVNNHSGGPAVINMSIQSSMAVSSVNQAVQDAIDAGFPVVAAAGNFNDPASTSSPGSVADAITVASTDVNDTRASDSNYGSLVDLFAPGEQILSAWIGSDSDTEAISGTSMAAPHVAGTAAIYLENNPSASPQQIRNFIVQHATKNVVSNAQSANDHMLYSLLNHPKEPTDLTVNCIPNDSPELDWDASASSDRDYYEVLRSSSPWSGYSQIGTTSSTSYKDTYFFCAGAGDPITEYWYRVRTVDTENLRSGESKFDSANTTDDNPYPYGSTESDSLETAQ